MRRIALLLVAVVAAACSSTQPHPATRPRPTQPVARATNALTPLATIDRRVVAPSIRVGLLSDQP